MKKILLSIICLFATQISFAGSADRILDCKSASGRTKVTGVVPGDSLTLELAYEIDGNVLYYTDSYVGNTYVKDSEILLLGSVTDAKPSFHFNIKNLVDGSSFTFVAIPTTVKVKQTGNGEAGTFKAYVVGTDPRNPDQAVSPTIEVTCNYNYEI